MTYIVMVSSAKMPSGVKAPYDRVALVELLDGWSGYPAMISERAKGVKRIVRCYERLHAGGKHNDASRHAQRELQAEADRLNAQVAT